MRISKTQKRILYTAYIVLVTLFFLYYLFPAESLKNYVVTKVQGINPQIRITLDNVTPSFPLGFVLKDVSVSYEENPVFEAELLRLSPSFLSLLTGKSAFKFKCHAYGGKIKGRAGVPLFGGGIDNMFAKADLTDVQIGKVQALKTMLPQYGLSGVLNGDIVFTADKKNKRTMTSNLTATDSKVDFLIFFYGIETLSFKEVDATLKLKNDILTVEKFVSNSTDLGGSVTGTVTLKNPFRRSKLDLEGDVTPGPAVLDKMEKLGPMVKMLLKSRPGDKGIPVRLTGTIERPGYFK